MNSLQWTIVCIASLYLPFVKHLYYLTEFFSYGFGVRETPRSLAKRGGLGRGIQATCGEPNRLCEINSGDSPLAFPPEALASTNKGLARMYLSACSTGLTSRLREGIGDAIAG